MRASASQFLQTHYILPLCWSHDEGLTELVTYLESIKPFVHVIVVDGSHAPKRARHAATLPDDITFLVCDNAEGLNGKVAGVRTAIPHLFLPNTIIADDDVRYSVENLYRIVGGLDSSDLVAPQNYFSAAEGHHIPWHTRWDSARSLINRAFGADYPGTLALRTKFLKGGYDGDVLFENLELIRTVIARGATVRNCGDHFIARRPPSSEKFLNQRVRQAYDSSAQPLRWTIELLLLPSALALLRRPLLFTIAAVLPIAVAEVGRRRSRGTIRFPATISLWAPAWVAERAVCAWIAVVLKLTGGVSYRGKKLPMAAHSLRQLKQIQQERSAHHE